MSDPVDPPASPPTSRRALLVATAASLSAMQLFKQAHGMERTPSTVKRGYSYRNDPDDADVKRYPGVHQGKGAIDVKFFFQDEGAPKPALLLIYDIPPGASEGVHTHNVGDRKEGSFDEFYYILSGSGEMQIAGERVPVKTGDHIFTPNGVAHGIENTATEGALRVYLVAMIRD